jgi:Protein of unknown function (DUF3632)
MNSFTVRMARDDLFDGSLFAIWEPRAALGRDNNSKPVANCNISAANEWVITSSCISLNSGPLDG